MTTSPGAVAQILTNLMMNSIIHGFNQGADPGNITVSARFDNDQVTLIYQDDGVGMDEKTLSRIYDPFFTTKRSEGGSGLGMNIVYNLITSKLNGYIDSESQVGQGIKITMTFAAQSA
jgi:signal transduction histidine kinase